MSTLKCTITTKQNIPNVCSRLCWDIALLRINLKNRFRFQGWEDTPDLAHLKNLKHSWLYNYYITVKNTV